MMSNPYAAFCEDFYVNMRLGSQLNLPHNRETLLHLFERVQKNYPTMSRFRKTDNGEFNLEEDRGGQSYRWMSLETKRLSSGHVNPQTVDQLFYDPTGNMLLAYAVASVLVGHFVIRWMIRRETAL